MRYALTYDRTALRLSGVRVPSCAPFAPEPTVTLLRQLEVSIANGKSTPQACKEAQITARTSYRWRKESGGSKLDHPRLSPSGL